MDIRLEMFNEDSVAEMFFEMYGTYNYRQYDADPAEIMEEYYNYSHMM